MATLKDTKDSQEKTSDSVLKQASGNLSKTALLGCGQGTQAHHQNSTKITAVVAPGEALLEVWGKNLVSYKMPYRPPASIWATFGGSTVLLETVSSFAADDEQDEDLLQLVMPGSMPSCEVLLAAHRLGYDSSGWVLPPLGTAATAKV